MDINPTVKPVRLTTGEIRIHACFDYRLRSFMVHA
jgi:hypothetical protein